MRRFGKRSTGLVCGLVLTILAAPGSAWQQPPRPTAPSPGATQASPAPAAPAIDPRKIDEILARWEKASTGIQRLYAEFEQVEDLQVAGVKKRYKGKAYLQRPNLALLQFDMQDAEDPEKYIFNRRIVCTGTDVLDYDAPTRQVIIFPLPEDARQRALEEGPLRFLFGMTVADFKARYEAKLLGENQKTYRIQLIPLQQVDKDAFRFAVLDLNKETLLPDAVYLMNPNGKDRQSYTLKRIEPNTTWATGNQLFAFDEQKSRELAEKGWRVIRNSGQEQGTAPELEPAARGPVGLTPRPGPTRPR